MLENKRKCMKACSESDLELIAFCILVLLVGITILPMTMMVITFIFLLENIKINKMILLALSIFTWIGCCIVSPTVIQSFISSVFMKTNNLIADFTVLNTVKFVFVDSFKYSMGSYVFMLLFALIIAIVMYEIYSYRKRLKNAGVTTFTSNVDDVADKKTAKTVGKMIENIDDITIIGTDNNNNIVYTKDNANHVFISGTTGSGKTVLLSNYILNAITKDYPALIVDGKGDLGEGSILEITKELCSKHDKKLYIINMTDIPSSDKYNPFKDSSATMCKDMLVNMSEWSEQHYKQNTERFIQRLFQLMEMSEIPLTFKNILANLSIEAFNLLSARLVKVGKITKDQHAKNIDISRASGKIAEEASARFSTIAESDIGTIFDDSGIDIFTALKEKAIILFVLNPLLYPEVSPLFGKLILTDATKAVSQLFADKDTRKFFIFDEINSYASNTLVNLINKSRSAKVTVIAATQSLADLEIVAGEPFREQIIENCNNYIVLRQNGNKGAETWAKILGTVQSMEITHQLGNNDSQDTIATGRGSAKVVREFIYHPDEIKSQGVGKAIYLSRDEDKHTKFNVRKPF